MLVVGWPVKQLGTVWMTLRGPLSHAGDGHRRDDPDGTGCKDHINTEDTCKITQGIINILYTYFCCFAECSLLFQQPYTEVIVVTGVINDVLSSNEPHPLLSHNIILL